MENQSRKNQQTAGKNAKIKKQSKQPRFGDKEWQVPRYDQNKSDEKNESKEGSCGCDS